MFNWLTNRLWGTAKTLDEEGNVILGPEDKVPAAGNAHYTISQRLAEMRISGSPNAKQFACQACQVLTWIANRFGYPGDHCTNSMKKMPWSIPSSSA